MNSLSNTPQHKKSIQRHHVLSSDAVQLTGGLDREAQIRNTLERLKQEKMMQAERESLALMDETRQQAQQIIQQAQEQAEQIVAEGQVQKKDAYDEGFIEGKTQGYKDGYRDGRDAADQDSRTLMISANTLLLRAYDAQVEVLNGFNRSAICIMRAILRRILTDAFNDFTDEQWLTWLSETIDQLNVYGKFKLVISDTSMQQFKKVSPQLGEALGGLERFHLLVDPKLDASEMFILGDEANADISPKNQAEQLMKAITEHIDLNRMVPEDINPPEEIEEFNQLLQPYFDPSARDNVDTLEEESELSSEDLSEEASDLTDMQDPMALPNIEDETLGAPPLTIPTDEPLVEQDAVPIRPLDTQDRIDTSDPTIPEGLVPDNMNLENIEEWGPNLDEL